MMQNLNRKNNMKKLYTICAALSLVAFVGCDNILDKEPIDQFTKDNFFTSETNVSSFANYFYNEFTGYGTGGGSGAFYFNTLNDDQASSGFQSGHSRPHPQLSVYGAPAMRTCAVRIF